MNKNTLHYLTYNALFLSIALIIGTIEHMLPPIIPILPFIKLGFSNIVILFAIIMLGLPSALIIGCLKSLLVPLFLGNPIMIIYSLPSTIIAVFISYALISLKKFGLPTVSIIASIMHSLSQLAVASVMMNTVLVFGYAPYIILTSSIAGVTTGIISYILIRYFPKNLLKL